MIIPSLVVIGIVVAAIGSIVGLLLRSMKLAEIPWVPVPGLNGTLCYLPKDMEPGDLVVPFLMVAKYLNEYVGWDANEVLAVVSKAKVVVGKNDDWTDEFGRHVAGVQSGNVLKVGHNLAGLLHETAHLYLEIVKGVQASGDVKKDFGSIYHLPMNIQ